MPTANVNDRNSLERIYPPDVFANDAAQNERQSATLLHGVRIGSAPDSAGAFALERAALHKGEVPGAVFLVPFHRATPREGGPVDPDPRHGYEAFLDEIIDTACRQGYRAAASPGPGDRRIRGARQ